MMHKIFSRHIVAIALAVLAGACTLFPQLIAEHRLGSSYAGIHQEMNDDETYYVTRAQEVIDGYPTLGNPYLYEEKHEPGLQVWIPDATLAWGSELLFHDLLTWELSATRHCFCIG